jgi:hypothetical protein
MFEPTKQNLIAILRDVETGKLQLPDFQRSYVWGDVDTRSLIASVAKGFPIGALLTMKTGSDVRFAPRPIEGAPDTGQEPAELLLDGQQRVTSLYQALYSDKPVETINKKNNRVKRYYYLDIDLVLQGQEDIEDAIVGVPEDRVLRTDFGRKIVYDLTTTEKEYEANLFPLNKSFDAHDWLYPWSDYWNGKGISRHSDQKRLWEEALELIYQYPIPVIALDEDNSREAICLVFEKVNVGGKKLDAFELVTAVYAADRFDLRKDWAGDKTTGSPGRLRTMIGYPNRRDVLTKLASTDFLQACTVLHTMRRREEARRAGKTGNELPQISCNRNALLALPLASYKDFADDVQEGFVRAAGVLNELKIIWHKDIPYPPLLVTIAATHAAMGGSSLNAAAKEKLARWIWSISLGELYGSSTDSRIARDVPELIEWISDGTTPPRSVDEAVFQQDRLLSLRSRLSAAYKAIHALLMARGCRDFVSGDTVELMTFFNDHIDIHHIFPQAWCKQRGIPDGTFNSVINKTPLSARTNRTIGGSAPSQYLVKIREDQGLSSAQLDEILETHLINPSHLRNDDFDAFFAERKEALSSLVEEGMGKSIVRVQDETEPEGEFVPPEGGLEDA